MHEIEFCPQPRNLHDYKFIKLCQIFQMCMPIAGVHIYTSNTNKHIVFFTPTLLTFGPVEAVIWLWNNQVI